MAGVLTKFTYSIENYYLLKDKDGALIEAIKQGSLEHAQFVLKHGADINRNQGLPIREAIKASNTTMLQLLIDQGALTTEIGERKGTILHQAVEDKQSETVSYLLNKGYDVDVQNGKGDWVLCTAMKQFDKEIFDALIASSKRGINDIDGEGNSLLHMLLDGCEGSDELVSYVLNKRFNINSFNKKGQSPIYLAIQNGNEKVMKELITRGAKLDQVTQDGKSAIDVATEMNKEVVAVFEEQYKLPIYKKDGKFYVNHVTLGMTVSEVQAILGKPVRRTGGGHYQSEIYSNQQDVSYNDGIADQITLSYNNYFDDKEINTALGKPVYSDVHYETRYKYYYQEKSEQKLVFYDEGQGETIVYPFLWLAPVDINSSFADRGTSWGDDDDFYKAIGRDELMAPPEIYE